MTWFSNNLIETNIEIVTSQCDYLYVAKYVLITGYGELYSNVEWHVKCESTATKYAQ